MKQIAPGAVTVKGIDVSRYQPNINWNAVHLGGIQFAFIKASEATFVDSFFHTHWNAAKAAGVLRGAYHYFHPSKDPAAQAKVFTSTIGHLDDTDLPCVMDWEVTEGVPNLTDLSRGIAFLKAVEAATHKTPIIYGSPYFLSQVANTQLSRYPLWVAHYGVKAPLVPDVWHSWDFWQNSEHAQVHGYGGQVDFDLFNGSMDQLKAKFCHIVKAA